MKTIAFSSIDFLQFILALLFVLISLSLGITLYVIKQNKEIKFAVITWIFFSFFWLAIIISGISYFLTGNDLTRTPFALLQLPFLPCSMISWIYTFTEYKFKEKRKTFLIAISIFVSSFLIIVFLLLAIYPSRIASLRGPFDISYRNYIYAFLVLFLVFFLVTASLLFVDFKQSADKKNVTKGLLLFMSFLFYLIAFIIYGIFPLNSIILTLIYGIFITCAILYYISFNIPFENIGVTPRPTSPQKHLSPAPIPAHNKIFCPNCGTPLKGIESFCTSCGLKINK